jgi:hypothetical protein
LNHGWLLQESLEQERFAGVTPYGVPIRGEAATAISSWLEVTDSQVQLRTDYKVLRKLDGEDTEVWQESVDRCTLTSLP